MKYYEVFVSDNYAICIKAKNKPTKEKVYDYLKEYESNAKEFDFTVDDIAINDITEEEAYNLYNMEYINNLPIME